jgi:hypothetical protein
MKKIEGMHENWYNWSSKKKRTKTLFLPCLSSSVSAKVEWVLYFNSSRKIRRLHPSQQLQKNQKQNLQNLFLSLWVSISSSRNKKSFSPSLALPLFAEKKIRNKASLFLCNSKTPTKTKRRTLALLSLETHGQRSSRN